MIAHYYRGPLRVLAAGLLVACPLVAADPPPIFQGGTYRVVDVRPLSSWSVDVPPVPPAPLGHYPACYTGPGWTPFTEALARAKRRGAERVPFDLKYLPPVDPDENGPHAIVAVRPSAVFDRPGGDRLAASWLIETGAFDFVMGFIGLSGMDWPAVHDLDMVLARCRLSARPSADGRYLLADGRANGAVVRTRERFDWRRAIGRAVPAAGTATYRGVEYRTTTVDARRYFPNDKYDTFTVGLYVADDRTLVIDNEDGIERLIDRLLNAEPPEEPTGWAGASTGVCTVAYSNPNKVRVLDLPAAAGPWVPKGDDWVGNFLGDVDELLIGLDDRPTTRLRVTATARDPFAGKRMTWNAKRLLARVAVWLVGETGPEADQARAIWRAARFAPTSRGFEITADAGGDLLGTVLDRLTPAATKAAQIGPPVPLFGAGFVIRAGTAFPSEFEPSGTDAPRTMHAFDTPTNRAFSGPPGTSDFGSSTLPVPAPPGYYDRSPISDLSGFTTRPE